MSEMGYPAGLVDFPEDVNDYAYNTNPRLFSQNMTPTYSVIN